MEPTNPKPAKKGRERMFGVLVIDEPALMEKWMDRLIAEEWPEFHAETRDARAKVNQDLAKLLKDPDAHKRVLTGLEGCLRSALVRPLEEADDAALIKLHHEHAQAMQEVRAAVERMRSLRPIGASALMVGQIALLIGALEREFVGPHVGPDYGKHMSLLLDLQRQQPGRIAELVAHGRLAEEYGWEFERVAMSHAPIMVVTTRSGKRIEKMQSRRGRKGYRSVAMNATVMANIIQYTAWSQNRSVARYTALKTVGRLLAAHLPEEYRGEVHVKAMYDKDRESKGRGISIAAKSDLLGK